MSALGISSVSENSRSTVTATPSTAVATKKCKCCRKVKPLTEFHRNHTYKDGHSSTCKECTARIREENRLKRANSVKTVVTVNLSEVTDDGLKEELQRRGWFGELQKVSTLSLAKPEAHNNNITMGNA